MLFSKHVPIMLCALLLISPTTLLAEGHESGGGGGVLWNGEYLTFPQAGIDVPGRPATRSSLAGITELEESLEAMFADIPMQEEFLKEVRPTAFRKYYWVDEIPAELYEHFLKSYKEVLGQELTKEKIAKVFAYTDIKNRETYLLPPFKTLVEQYQNPNTSPEQRSRLSLTIQSTLFHEARWLVIPGLTYRDNMIFDHHFKDFMSSGFSIEFFRDLARVRKDPWISIRAAMAQENRLIHDHFKTKRPVFEIADLSYLYPSAKEPMKSQASNLGIKPPTLLPIEFISGIFPGSRNGISSHSFPDHFLTYIKNIRSALERRRIFAVGDNADRFAAYCEIKDPNEPLDYSCQDPKGIEPATYKLKGVVIKIPRLSVEELLYYEDQLVFINTSPSHQDDVMIGWNGKHLIYPTPFRLQSTQGEIPMNLCKHGQMLRATWSDSDPTICLTGSKN